jgi:hypothetical protein
LCDSARSRHSAQSTSSHTSRKGTARRTRSCTVQNLRPTFRSSTHKKLAECRRNAKHALLTCACKGHLHASGAAYSKRNLLYTTCTLEDCRHSATAHDCSPQAQTPRAAVKLRNKCVSVAFGGTPGVPQKCAAWLLSLCAQLECSHDTNVKWQNCRNTPIWGRGTAPHAKGHQRVQHGY